MNISIVLHFLAIVNNGTMNIFFYVFLCGYVFSFFLSVYLGAELPGHMVTSCWGIESSLFYNPTNNVWGFKFLHMLSNTSCCLFILVDIKWYFIVILICSSLITIDIVHIVICLLTCYMSYLEECTDFLLFNIGLSFYCWIIRVLYIFIST